MPTKGVEEADLARMDLDGLVNDLKALRRGK